MMIEIEKLVNRIDLYIKGNLITHITVKYWEELKELLKNDER